MLTRAVGRCGTLRGLSVITMPTKQFSTAFVVLLLSLSAAQFRMFDAVDMRQERAGDSCAFVESTSLVSDVVDTASAPLKERAVKVRRSSAGLKRQFVAKPLGVVAASRRIVRLSTAGSDASQQSSALRI